MRYTDLTNPITLLEMNVLNGDEITTHIDRLVLAAAEGRVGDDLLKLLVKRLTRAILNVLGLWQLQSVEMTNALS